VAGSETIPAAGPGIDTIEGTPYFWKVNAEI